jgi:hypothetical protein
MHAALERQVSTCAHAVKIWSVRWVGGFSSILSSVVWIVWSMHLISICLMQLWNLKPVMFSWEDDTPSVWIVRSVLDLYMDSLSCTLKTSGKLVDWSVSPVCPMSLAYPLLQIWFYTWIVFGLFPYVFPEWNWPIVVVVILTLWELSWNWLNKRVFRPVDEEVGCQAYEKLSLGERVCWQVVFSQRESNTSYGAPRIHDPACCQDP